MKVSQGNIATRLRCDEIFNQQHIATWLLSTGLSSKNG